MFKVLASRIVVFALACLWVLGWLATGLIWYDIILGVLTQYGTPWLVTPLLVWYVATLVLVGIWVTIKGFKFVGKWEKNES